MKRKQSRKSSRSSRTRKVRKTKRKNSSKRIRKTRRSNKNQKKKKSRKTKKMSGGMTPQEEKKKYDKIIEHFNEELQILKESFSTPGVNNVTEFFEALKNGDVQNGNTFYTKNTRSYNFANSSYISLNNQYVITTNNEGGYIIFFVVGGKIYKIKFSIKFETPNIKIKYWLHLQNRNRNRIEPDQTIPLNYINVVDLESEIISHLKNKFQEFQSIDLTRFTDSNFI